MNVFKLIEDNGLNLHGDIEHFAELIRADEREACAKKWVNLTDEEFDQVLKEFSHDPRAMAIELEIRIMEKNT